MRGYERETVMVTHILATFAAIEPLGKLLRILSAVPSLNSKYPKRPVEKKSKAQREAGSTNDENSFLVILTQFLEDGRGLGVTSESKGHDGDCLENTPTDLVIMDFTSCFTPGHGKNGAYNNIQYNH